MQIYLIRHAIAEERGTDVDDARRALTPRGIARMRRIVAGLAERRVALKHVWTSPLARAVETAQIIVTGLELPHPPQVVPELAPGGTPEAVLAALMTYSKRGAVALVGHEPDLGILAAYLTTGLKSHAMRLKKGGVACLSVKPAAGGACAALRWLMTPRQLIELAEKSP